jgi:hypothetical protein
MGFGTILICSICLGARKWADYLSLQDTSLLGCYAMSTGKYIIYSVEITNKMQPCNRIYYSTVHWRLNMFRAAHRSSTGALTIFAASGLHTHVVTGRSQVWMETAYMTPFLISLKIWDNQQWCDNRRELYETSYWLPNIFTRRRTRNRLTGNWRLDI